MVWPLIALGLASTAVSAYSANKQADAQKKAAKARAASATPQIASGGGPAPYQGPTGLGQSAPQQQAFQAAAPKPFTPTQVVTAPTWNAQAPGGGAAMAAPQNAALANNWASDYSRGMAGSGAPMSVRPSPAPSPGIQSPVASLYATSPNDGGWF